MNSAGCTQPVELAATSLAGFVALGVGSGATVVRGSSHQKHWEGLGRRWHILFFWQGVRNVDVWSCSHRVPR